MRRGRPPPPPRALQGWPSLARAGQLLSRRAARRAQRAAPKPRSSLAVRARRRAALLPDWLSRTWERGARALLLPAPPAPPLSPSAPQAAPPARQAGVGGDRGGSRAGPQEEGEEKAGCGACAPAPPPGACERPPQSLPALAPIRLRGRVARPLGRDRRRVWLGAWAPPAFPPRRRGLPAVTCRGGAAPPFPPEGTGRVGCSSSSSSSSRRRRLPGASLVSASPPPETSAGRSPAPLGAGWERG